MSIYSAELNYLNEITGDEIIVVFNGTTYTVPKRIRTLQNGDTHTYYGTLGLVNDGDATGEYPFCIYVAQGLNTVYVSEDVYDNHNPFTIKIMEESVTTTPCFEAAVKQASGSMGSVSVASRGYKPKTLMLTPAQQYSVPANSSAQILFTNSTLALSELATIHSIILPDGIVINSINFDTAPNRRSIYMGVRNVTGNDIAVSVSNAKIELIDWREADQVCVMASNGCSSPEPSPK